MSAIDDLDKMFGHLPEEERLRVVLEHIQEGIREGVIIPIRDPDGETRYIHKEHYNGEPVVPYEQVVANHQIMLYGQGLN